MKSFLAAALLLSAVQAESKEIRVMVIDTGIYRHEKLSKWLQPGVEDDYTDKNGHGTHIAGIVALGNHKLDDPVCEEVKIFSCKYFNPGDNALERTETCIQKAIDLKVDYINYSGGGTEYSTIEHELYRKFTSQGGTLVAAAGNEKSDLREHPFYPASYAFGVKHNKDVLPALNNIIVVENKGKNGKILPSSNHHPLALGADGDNIYSTIPYDLFGNMTGSSQSTAQVLHIILKQRCKDINNSFQMTSN